MRIIGGEFRSRRLVTPRDALVTRPIPDRVKESVFGLLRGHTEGAAVFDGFAGTGAIGLEAISRGAARCVFVERDRRIADILRQNITNLGVEDRCDVVMGDALGPGALARCPRPANLIFLDPPYPLVQSALGWKRVRAQFERLIDLLADDGFAVLRTPWPFQVEVATEEAETAIEQKPERKFKKPRRPKRDQDDREWDPRRFDERAGLPAKGRRHGHAELSSSEDGPQPPGEGTDESPSVAMVEADLAFTNAQGPETHVYHTMAVHLYARRT